MRNNPSHIVWAPNSRAGKGRGRGSRPGHASCISSSNNHRSARLLDELLAAQRPSLRSRRSSSATSSGVKLAKARSMSAGMGGKHASMSERPSSVSSTWTLRPSRGSRRIRPRPTSLSTTSVMFPALVSTLRPSSRWVIGPMCSTASSTPSCVSVSPDGGDPGLDRGEHRARGAIQLDVGADRRRASAGPPPHRFIITGMAACSSTCRVTPPRISWRSRECE